MTRWRCSTNACAVALVLGFIACNPSTPKSGVSGVSGAPTSAPALSGAGLSAPVDAGSAPTTDGSASAAAARVKMVEATSDTDALTLIRTMRLQARSEGRVLVVYVGAGWCDPCKKFRAELRSGRLDERLGNVTLLAFDADTDADRLGSGGYVFKFVPFVALPAADGRPSDAQEATGKGGQAWRELLGKLDAWQRPAP